MSLAPPWSPTPDTVAARLRRPISFDMFADLLDATVLGFDTSEVGWASVTFDRDLTPEEATAVAARLSSADDDDLAHRQTLAELVAAVEALPADPVRDLLLGLARQSIT